LDPATYSLVWEPTVWEPTVWEPTVWEPTVWVPTVWDPTDDDDDDDDYDDDDDDGDWDPTVWDPTIWDPTVSGATRFGSCDALTCSLETVYRTLKRERCLGNCYMSTKIAVTHRQTSLNDDETVEGRIFRMPASSPKTIVTRRDSDHHRQLTW
jgi:hypothetical protein